MVINVIIVATADDILKILRKKKQFKNKLLLVHTSENHDWHVFDNTSSDPIITDYPGMNDALIAYREKRDRIK